MLSFHFRKFTLLTFALTKCLLNRSASKLIQKFIKKEKGNVYKCDSESYRKGTVELTLLSVYLQFENVRHKEIKYGITIQQRIIVHKRNCRLNTCTFCVY